MILPIVLYGSKTLRSKAHDFDKEDSFIELATNMIHTLKTQKGYGLAGPQVAVLKNIFVIDATAGGEKGTDADIRM